MMAKRISKRVREEAALICAVMASSSEVTGRAQCYMPDASLSVGVSNDDSPACIARKAFWSIPEWNSRDDRECWAEAESLIRTGWSP